MNLINLADWIRFLLYRAVSSPEPKGYDGGRYPRTVRGGARFWREQIAGHCAEYYRCRIEQRKATR